MTEHAPLSEKQREAAFKDLSGLDRGAMIEAAYVLAEDKSTTSKLLSLLESERRVDNRHAILYALTWHGDERTWDLMVRILLDPCENPRVRGQAAEGLSYMFAEKSSTSKEFETATKALVEVLKDPSPEVRYCAVNALGSTGHLPLIPAIKALLDDRSPVEGWIGSVADEAFRALERLGHAHAMRRKNGL